MTVPALTSSLLIVLALVLPAQEPAPRDPASVFRSGASLVALNVTVSDGKRFVAGLGRQDFEVYEDGIRQQVQFFESSGVPVDLILLLDASASMRDKMGIVHEAALGFLKTLGPADRGAVVAFSDGVEILQTLTSDRDLLAAAVKRAQPQGATAMHNALYVALKQFGRLAQQAGDVRRQAIAVLSDGQDTTSLVSFDDVLGQARRSGVSIYTIGVRSEPLSGRRPESERHTFSESDYSLKLLAKETGGQSFFPDVVHQLKGVYAVIAEELSSQYSIGYASTNPRADGRFRQIQIKMTSRPDLRARARLGYVAEAAPARQAGRLGR